MNKSIGSAAAILLAAAQIFGCRGVTAHMNRHNQIHVRYEASKLLDCDEKKLLAQCTDAYKSGECREYAVRGCGKAANYRNFADQGWTADH